MNPIASVGTGTLSPAWPGAGPATLPASPAPNAEGSSRDAQMADLGSTSSQVNALQSLAMSASAPITIPPPQNFQPPAANTSDELVASMSGGNDDT